MFCEAFATGIKIESNNQSPFLGANQGNKVTSKLQKQQHVATV